MLPQIIVPRTRGIVTPFAVAPVKIGGDGDAHERLPPAITRKALTNSELWRVPLRPYLVAELAELADDAESHAVIIVTLATAPRAYHNRRGPCGWPETTIPSKEEVKLALQGTASWAALPAFSSHSPAGPACAASYVATPLTEEKSFTAGIEGPACDADGNIYAVNFAQAADDRQVTPDGKGEVWVTLPGKSAGNGIVFDKKGMMYVADYVGHNVLKIDPKTKKITVFAHEPKMNQPNDLAIAPDGTLYASDPNWDKSTGQLWRIGTRRQGDAASPTSMGTTNGIEVSPDGKTLYVNESVQRNVWAFHIDARRHARRTSGCSRSSTTTASTACAATWTATSTSPATARARWS